MIRELIARLREASAGYDEWRVQDPKDGSYCIAYSWPESFNPERLARAWLADHKARYPNSLHSGFVVACVRVVNDADRLRLEAATLLEQQAAEIERLRAALLTVYNAESRPEARAAIDAAMSTREGA